MPKSAYQKQMEPITITYMLIQYPHNLDRLLISVDIEGTPGVELSIYWNFYKATVISINLHISPVAIYFSVVIMV